MSSMDDLAPLATGVEDGGTPRLGQELLHNVGLMVGLAEAEIQARRNVCFRVTCIYLEYIILYTPLFEHYFLDILLRVSYGLL